MAAQAQAAQAQEPPRTEEGEYPGRAPLRSALVLPFNARGPRHSQGFQNQSHLVHLPGLTEEKKEQRGEGVCFLKAL